MPGAHCSSGQSRAQVARSGEVSSSRKAAKPQHRRSAQEPGGPLPRTSKALWRCCLAAAAPGIRPSLDL